MSVVRGFLQLTPNDTAGSIGFDRSFVSGLSHLSSGRICILMTIFARFVRGTGRQDQ
jgi:hypothetical protein